MQLRPYAADPNEMITLLNGQVIAFDSIIFDTGTYHFTANGDDITDQLPRSVKDRFPNFDPVADNYRLSYERGNSQAVVDNAGIAPTAPLDTNVGTIFAQNLVNTPFGSGGPSMQTIMLYGVVALVGYSLLNKSLK